MRRSKPYTTANITIKGCFNKTKPNVLERLYDAITNLNVSTAKKEIK